MTENEARKKAIELARVCIRTINNRNNLTIGDADNADRISTILNLPTLLRAKSERDELKLRLYGKDPTADEIAGFPASDPKLSPEDEAALERARVSFPYALKETRLRIKAEHTCDQLREQVNELTQSFDLQRKNYVQLCEAVIGRGTIVGMPDPFEVATKHRTDNLLLKAALQTVSIHCWKQHEWLRACRHSMDSAKPFPSQDKLNILIRELPDSVTKPDYKALTAARAGGAFEERGTG